MPHGHHADHRCPRHPPLVHQSLVISPRQAYLVQIEHDVPSRGGWIRAWIVDDTGTLRTYATLPDAMAAIERFADDPQWTQCRKCAGV